MKPFSALSPTSWLTAALLVISFNSAPATAGGEGALPFIAGTVAGVMVAPYLAGYQGNSLFNYGPVNGNMQNPPMVYNMPTPMPSQGMMGQQNFGYSSPTPVMGYAQPMLVSQPMVNYQPAVIYTSVIAPSPQPVIYAGPSSMPYILIR